MLAAAFAAAIVCIALCGRAQAAPDWDLSQHWNFTIGGAAIVEPSYEGSRSFSALPVPYFDIEWNDRLSINVKDGVHLAVVKWQDLSIGPSANYVLPRNSSDDRVLKHMGDVGLSIETGGYIDYNPRGFDISLEARHDIAGGHGGTVIEFAMRGQIELGDAFGMEFGPNLTWASKDYMQSYFGVTPKQAMASGYAPFNAGGGFKDVGFTVSAIYKFDTHWQLLGQVDYARLLGDAAKSPLVHDHGSANQLTFIAAVAYRF